MKQATAGVTVLGVDWRRGLFGLTFGWLLCCGLAACQPPINQTSQQSKALIAPENPLAGVPRISGLSLQGTNPLGVGKPEPFRTVVRFPSKDQALADGSPTILEAALFRPASPGRVPVVVALHDCMGLYGPSGDINSHMQDWAERLVAQGYAVLMPDSFNPRGVPEICDHDPEFIRPGMERARDAEAALSWIEAQPWADIERVGLIGWANGGTTALTFATQDGRLSERSGRYDFRLIIAFYPNCRTLAQAPGWRSDLPLMILTGNNDDWAPASSCVELARVIGNEGGAVDLIRYFGADHDFDAPGMPVHLKSGLTTTASGGATIGTDPQARADSVERVSHLLASALREN